MEGFAVTCPLAPDAPRLISGSCSSPRSFGLDFLQTPSRDDALALLLAFSSAKTWQSDLHLVWTLGALFDSPLAADLTFKGGTSLSKAYKVINRFSEDIDLTYDIRKLIEDLVGDDNPLPTSRSQANKWTKAVRERLPGWITENVRLIIESASARDQADVELEIGGREKDKLLLHYPAVKHGTGYVPPVVTLEFGGRATGEPIKCCPSPATWMGMFKTSPSLPPRRSS